jgi:CubicO group peptidase (beta-lactamase class C family)
MTMIGFGPARCLAFIIVATLLPSALAGAEPSVGSAPASAATVLYSPLEGVGNAASYSERHNGSAVVVMSGGRVVFETYASKADATRAHRLASGTKSFWGALAMAAVEDGLFKLDERVADTLTEWRDDPNRSRIRVRQLLDFTSGLDPATRLLQGKPKADDKFKRVLGVQSVDVPGTTFAYGPSHLFAFGVFLQRKLRAAGRPDDPVDYLKRRILDPIGLRIGRWTRDEAGNPIMSAGAFVAPREWIKFGQLLNNAGQWEGRSIIDRDLLMQVFQGSDANPAYGLTLWLNRTQPGSRGRFAADANAARRSANSDDGRISRSAPSDLAMAAGSGKQRLYLIPSLDLVIVRQGESKGSGWSDAEFLDRLLSNRPPLQRGADLSAAPPPDWRSACAVEIDRFCGGEPDRQRPLARCLRRHRDQLSAGCISAARAARRRAD